MKTSFGKKFQKSVTVIFFLLITGCSSMKELDFDAFIWQSQKGNFSPENPRGSMIDALEKYHIQIGMERKKIRKLLGKPDSTIDQTDIYDIGVSPFGIDFETYQIDYKAEMAVKFYVTRG